MARNGKGFLLDLAAREAHNHEFNFLKNTHSLFGFFSALCDAYSRVLLPPANTEAALRRDATDRSAESYMIRSQDPQGSHTLEVL